MTEESGEFARVFRYPSETGEALFNVRLYSGELIFGGLSKIYAWDVATRINAAHEKAVAEAVRKAKEEMREHYLGYSADDFARYIKLIEVKP